MLGTVLIGALLHAGWNALAKSSSDKALDMAILNLAGSVLAVPLVMLVGLPAAQVWPGLLSWPRC